MSVTNPLGQTYRRGDSSGYGSGSYVPWTLAFQLNDFQRSTELLIHNGEFANYPHRTSTEIREESFSGGGLFYERGFWTFSQIPEPSVPTLLFVGGTAYIARRRRRSRV